jgi:hypothetical protein
MEFEEFTQRFGGIRPVVGDTFLPLADGEIADIERAIGHQLPALYRQFLSRYGASGFQRLVLFRSARRLPPHISDWGGDYLSALYGKEPEGRDMFDLLTRIRFYKGRMPDSMIPIGDNGLGNQICLGVSGEAFGKVFYWDRHNEFDEDDYLEDHEPPVPPEMLQQNVHLVAHSFEDFLQRLEIAPDE